MSQLMLPESFINSCYHWTIRYSLSGRGLRDLWTCHVQRLCRIKKEKHEEKTRERSKRINKKKKKRKRNHRGCLPVPQLKGKEKTKKERKQRRRRTSHNRERQNHKGKAAGAGDLSDPTWTKVNYYPQKLHTETNAGKDEKTWPEALKNGQEEARKGRIMQGLVIFPTLK